MAQKREIPLVPCSAPLAALGPGACGSRGGGEHTRRAARLAPRPGRAARHAGRSGGGGRTCERGGLVRGADRSPSRARRVDGQAYRDAPLRGKGVPDRGSLREILGRLVGGATEPSGDGPPGGSTGTRAQSGRISPFMTLTLSPADFLTMKPSNRSL